MKEKLIAVLGLDEDASDEQVVNAVQYLMRVSNSPGAKIEKAVREKVAAGLSREAAIQVLQDQALDDEIRSERDEQAAQAAAEAAKAAKGKAAKGNDAGTGTGAGTPPAATSNP